MTLVSTTIFIGNAIFLNVGASGTCLWRRRTRSSRSGSSCCTSSSPGGSAPSRRSDDHQPADAYFLAIVTIVVLGVRLHPDRPDLHLCVQPVDERLWPPSGLSLRWFQEAAQEHRPPAGVPVLDHLRPRGDDRGARPGHAGIARGLALPLLRPGDRVIHRDLSDRPAGHHHRHRPPHDLRTDRIPARPLLDRHRSCDVLHRPRLQQRARPPPTVVELVRGGVGRPRRDLMADVPAGDVPGPPLGAARWRPPGLRAVVR